MGSPKQLAITLAMALCVMSVFRVAAVTIGVASLVLVFIAATWYLSPRRPWPCKAYVVSIKDGPRDRGEVAHRLSNIKFDFYDAVDGRAADIPPNFNPELKPGERGCAMSHINLWHHIHSQNPQGHVLILEDDVRLDDDFNQQLVWIMQHLDQTIDIVFLGHCIEKEGRVWRSAERFALRQSVTPRCTHAYLLTPRGLQKLVEWSKSSNVDEPIDEELANLVRSGALQSLSVFPPIAHQTGTASTINR